MSDNYLQLVPTDPFFVPPSAIAERARARLEQLVPDADEVNVEVSDSVRFINPVENWEGARCPSCGTMLDDQWVADEIIAAEERRGRPLEVPMPCCGATTSLNDLEYQWPAGFARFVLEAMNPTVDDPEPAWVAEIAEIAGTPLKTIWTRI